jgi:hypothetical protein
MIQYIIAAGIGAFLGSQSKKSKKSYAKGGEVDKWEYIYLTKTPNGLKVELTDEGIEAYNDEEVIEMYDLFEDIQANSEWNFIDDAGQVGFGLTSAPIITDGYYYDDDGNFTDEGHSDSRLYVWNDYMVKDLFATLMEQGAVTLMKVENNSEEDFAKGGETKPVYDNRRKTLEDMVRQGDNEVKSAIRAEKAGKISTAQLHEKQATVEFFRKKLNNLAKGGKTRKKRKK